MSILLQLPIKFECKHCQQIYFHSYAQSALHPPHCPDCQHAGLLMGVAEKTDLLRYPILWIGKVMKQSWHKLNKAHS